ncbi:hypothetical protein [Streptomyces mirabilis]|uniref:hypothetical protein n=1 Tax=Streptomyces mirabilis TaxID=68239 RepID=UPI0033C38554
MAATTFIHLTAPLPPAATAAMARIEYALAAPQRELAAKVGQALGFRGNCQPREDLGETATRHIVWSQVELNDVFVRVGGTVTSRQVERSTSDGSSTWTATEITVTVDVPGVGPVQVSTDLEDESAVYPTDLPVVSVARYQAAAVRYQALATCGDYEGCEYVRDEMAMCRCQLADAGRLDLIEAAS